MLRGSPGGSPVKTWGGNNGPLQPLADFDEVNELMEARVTGPPPDRRRRSLERHFVF